MSFSRACPLLCGLILLHVSTAYPQPGPPQDATAQAQKPPAGADPLPPGAVACLGTPPKYGVSAVAYSPDRKTLVGIAKDVASGGKLTLLDVVTGKKLGGLKVGKADLRALALTPDGQSLALSWDDRPGSEDANNAYLWDVAKGKELRRFGGHFQMVISGAIAPDGKTVATTCGHALIRLWDPATAKEVRQLRAATFSLAFSPDGKLLASGDGTVNTGEPIDVLVRLWDPATGKVVRRFSGQKDYVWSVFFSADGKTLASVGSRDKTVVLWDVASGKELRRFTNQHANLTTPLALTPDGKKLAMWRPHGIFFRDIASGEDEPPSSGFEYVHGSVAFSPDGTTLAAGGIEAILLWDARMGAPLHRLSGSHRSAAFSSDGKTLAAPNGKSEVSIWEVATGKERSRFPAPPADKDGLVPLCWCVAFIQKSDIVAASYGDAVHLWDVAVGKELRRLAVERRFAYVQSLASSPNGKLLAAGCGAGGGVYVWDVVTGKLLHHLETRDKDIPRVFTVAFSPDGKTLTCALGTHKVEFWELNTGKHIKTLKWPNPDGSDSPFYLAYSPAGGLIAAYGRDEGVRLIDVATGKEVGRLAGDRGHVDSVAFSPDGKRLAADGDGTVLIWDVAEALRKAPP